MDSHHRFDLPPPEHGVGPELVELYPAILQKKLVVGVGKTLPVAAYLPKEPGAERKILLLLLLLANRVELATGSGSRLALLALFLATTSAHYSSSSSSRPSSAAESAQAAEHIPSSRGSPQ